MNDEPRRKFWQFHLSTAVLLTFVAALALGLNVRKRTEDDLKGAMRTAFRIQYECHNASPLSVEEAVLLQGCPYSFRKVYTIGGSDVPVMSYPAAFADFVAAVSVVIATAFISEWSIRRREARKT
jgi:hypothetical protein